MRTINWDKPDLKLVPCDKNEWAEARYLGEYNGFNASRAVAMKRHDGIEVLAAVDVHGGGYVREAPAEHDVRVILYRDDDGTLRCECSLHETWSVVVDNLCSESKLVADKTITVREGEGL